MSDSNIVKKILICSSLLILPATAAWASPARLTCSDVLKSADLGDEQVRVTVVHRFRAGEVVALPGQPSKGASTATTDLCFVKVLIGPGNPGPSGAPSTSPGIGLEVWLPEPDQWNQRYIGFGSGGYSGSISIQAHDRVSEAAAPPNSGANAISNPLLLAQNGYITSVSDDGHLADASGLDGSFALNPDGTLNWPLLIDFAYRGIHETAVKTKALAKAYYGSTPMFSYWIGTSTGGRQGLQLAQRYPADFNGIIAAMPAINWSSFVPATMWPQIVMQNDIGHPIATAKLEAVHAAATAACDSEVTGKHDGYLSYPETCRYDPLKDQAMLCVADGGRNNTDACLSVVEARAINKIWFGPRADGEMVDPGADNGAGPQLALGQLWFGLNRGALLHNSPLSHGVGMAGKTPFPIGSDWLAIVMADPRLATATFQNAKSDERDGWKALGYAGNNSFADVFIKSIQRAGFLIDAAHPDLSEFKRMGGKIIHWHGVQDNIIPEAGSRNYYEQVLAVMGGMDQTRSFYRYYAAPGLGHAAVGGPGEPAPVPGGDPLTHPYKQNLTLLPILQDWVEKGTVPGPIVATVGNPAQPKRSRPWCPYPERVRYQGGNPDQATSFRCD